MNLSFPTCNYGLDVAVSAIYKSETRHYDNPNIT